MTDNDLVRYCTHCGAKMSMKTKTEYSSARFDERTGQALFREAHIHHYWKCPNKVWHFDNHDQYSDYSDSISIPW